MAMNRNMTMAEKEVQDYAKRQMERAEQRINILFSEGTERAGSGICGYDGG